MLTQHRAAASRHFRRWRLPLLASSIVVLMAFMVQSAEANHGTGTGQSFTFLEAGFTQDVYGAADAFLGGVAFAPDGDPWVDTCAISGSPLYRFDSQSTPPPVNGTNIHTVSLVGSNAGCGLSNHPDGFLYSNTGGGAVQIDASTGAATGNAYGPAGNGLGIASDPQTGDVVYAAQNCSFGPCDIITVDPDTGISSVFVTLGGTNFVDGIAFSPDGSQLFLANRSPSFALTVIDRTAPGARTGVFNRNIALPSEPDGIAFHGTGGFVVTNNTDGTMTKIAINAGDALSLFASGGFRGDLSQVGSDGCLYLTQDGTRYDDGTVTGENSLVRICGGFVPPVPPTITATPATATNDVGASHTVTANVLAGDNPVEGAQVSFTVVSGPNTGEASDPGECSANADCTTDSDGNVSWTYTGAAPGTDAIEVCLDQPGRDPQCVQVEKIWVDESAPSGACVEATNPAGATVPNSGPNAGKSGQNPDGFYQVTASDNVAVASIVIRDDGSSFVSGPFTSGDVVKIVQAPGATPSDTRPGPGVVVSTLKLKGDAVLVITDTSGNVTEVTCTVPPPPK